MEEDLFTEADQPDEKTLRAELTAKWKEKFPDAPEELIETKVESDVYIKTLEWQKDQLRADYMKSQEEIQRGKALETLIDQLKTKDTQAPTPTKPTENTQTPTDFDQLFEMKYETKKRVEIENNNFNEVQKKLRERFGHNAPSVLSDQAQALGLSKDDVHSLAKKSPEAFFRVMGLDQQRNTENFMTPPRSDVRSDHFAPKPIKRTMTFYNDMRLKNPKQYWDPKTQVQMHKDGEALGVAFFDDEDPVFAPR